MLLAPGESIHSKRFLQMLLELGHHITLIDSYDPLPEGAKNYRFVSYPKRPPLFMARFRTMNRIAHLIQTLLLKRIWKSVKPDIVHVHWIDSRAEQCALANIHPLVLTCWGSDINNLFESKHSDDVYRRRIIKALSSADYITADTKQVLERCETLVGKKLPTGLFYFGIDLEKFKPDLHSGRAIYLRKNLNIPANAKVILSIRRLVPMMGHQHILRAFTIASSQTEEDLVLILHHYLGKDTEYEIKLRNLADDLGISSKIIWLNGITDEQMPELYSLSDLVVNFPDYDGLPVSLFEAAACKKPIITNDLKAYSEILSEGAFTVVPAGNNYQLATAIKKVVETPEKEMELSLQRNYELIVRIADQHQCINKMEQDYSRLSAKANHV